MTASLNLKSLSALCRRCPTCTPPRPPRNPISSSLIRRQISCRSHSTSRTITNTFTIRTISPTRTRNISNTSSKMSNTFSNTQVPEGKPADPYKAANKSEPELKEKVEDLTSFITSCKFGMMTTRVGSTGLLTSRCMAVAAKVKYLCPLTQSFPRQKKTPRSCAHILTSTSTTGRRRH